MQKIKKILIANRGEIALRVMRTARDMGIGTVAIFSEADRKAEHVMYADEAVCVGPPASRDSYLNQDRVMEAARQTGADAIHPGYGFLSENATFARRVEKEGLIFIGPTANAMEIMGSKLAAKEAVSKYDIPMIPGTDHAITDIKEASKVASDIGYPILIKASAGGGGKGMRVVESEAELEEQMERAISEAASAFGDGSVFIEKYITSPRHIEFQVFGDQHGNYVHLFERECSIQRRHQKVIEEAPSAIVTPELRDKMGKAAIYVAKSCSYVGAGTVEFIVDQNRDFYFLEMNTRLQVEHPVTELITGLDLVQLQIKIAEGDTIPFKQEEVEMKGHALECRVYAEDPENQFLPDIGTLHTYAPPRGPGVRVDDGYRQGMDIPIHYDPMISKLITYGENRHQAIQRMIRAIDDYHISGLSTTLSFCKYACDHEAFRSGDFDTNFVKNHFTPEKLHGSNPHTVPVAAAFAALTMKNQQEELKTPAMLANGQQTSNWKLRMYSK